MVTVCLLKDETEEMLRQRRLSQIQHQQKVIRSCLVPLEMLGYGSEATAV